MPQRTLGSQGLSVSAIGLGCGATFLDTADMYGRGFLTGRYRSIDDFEPDDFRRRSPRFQGENFVEENIRAADVTLSEEELRRIDEVAPVGVAAGNRYPDMSTVNR